MSSFDATTSELPPVPMSRKQRRAQREHDALCARKSMLPAAAFDRLVRELLQAHGDEYRVSADVSAMLRCAAEEHVHRVVTAAGEFAQAAKRDTLQPEDMQRARRVLGV
jgi:histone H3/H4